MCFGDSRRDRSHSEWPARPIELTPLSIQSSPSARVRVPSSAHLSSSSSGGVRSQRRYASSSASSGGLRLSSSYAPSSSSGSAQLSSTSGSSSSPSSIYIQDPVDWNTRPEVLARYRQYKAADVRSSRKKRRYEIERRGRTVEEGHRSQTYTPRNLTLESHQYLGPIARSWKDIARQHSDMRQGFLTDYPRAYRSRAKVRSHRKAIRNARNSAANAKEFEKEHFRYGGNFQQCDPYDNYDRRTGASQGAGPREYYDYKK